MNAMDADLPAATHRDIPAVTQPLVTPGTPLLTLEVLSGKTRFPSRPVHKERFLIGSGTRCDLRLAGDRIPQLHSVVIAGLDEILIERIAPAPALIINGQLVSGGVLHHGDTIRIGGVELRAAIPVTAPVVASDPLLAPVDEFLTEAELTGVDPDLAADDLVDLIAEALGESGKLRARLEAGADALLDEARRRTPSRNLRTDAPAPPPAGPHWNTARIPLERAAAERAALDQATAQSELLHKIDSLELEVARVTRQLATLETTRDASTSAVRTRAGELRRAKASMLEEINALFDRIETPTSRRASA
jgi:hypothetical protein